MGRIALLLAAACLAASLDPALAKNDKAKGERGGDSEAVETLLDMAITAAEIAIIYDYLANHGSGALGPPQGLPPGIAKNLARGKPLPPGIAKRYLPGPLLTQLPRPGYDWLVVDNDILLVVAATAVIVDILEDAF